MPSSILRLHIQRFRGIEDLTWHPGIGVNVILGGGNVGKSTVLDAIALLMHPTNSHPISDADYWRRQVAAEFMIEAVMSLPEVVDANRQQQMNWPWLWDGENAVVPPEDAGEADATKAVYRFRVRGTDELELVYEVIQPDGNVSRLSTGLRRAIGLVRLAGDDRNDADLRLVRGSGLDRLLSDGGLRGRLGHRLGDEEVEDELGAEGKAALAALETTFAERALPTQLGLGITGGSGYSLNALVGLMADKDGIKLPLANWGAGTRRLAALTIADNLQTRAPITVVDEIERGLEPYRQRGLVETLIASGHQIFLTSHSPAVVSAAAEGDLWYLDANQNIGELRSTRIAQHQAKDPDTFLARLAVVCEGATEVGFTLVLLELALENPLKYGVWVTDGGGNDYVLDLLEGLARGKLTFAGMADNEGRNPERWAAVKAQLNDLLLQWQVGSIEEHVVPKIDPAQLKAFVSDPSGIFTGMRLRTLADRLGVEEASYEEMSEVAGDDWTRYIIEAATGHIPPEQADADRAIKKTLKGHGKVWFKSEEGGRELAAKVFQLGAWPSLRAEVLRFVNAVRATVGLPALEDLPQ